MITLKGLGAGIGEVLGLIVPPSHLHDMRIILEKKTAISIIRILTKMCPNIEFPLHIFSHDFIDEAVTHIGGRHVKVTANTYLDN